MRIQYFDRQAGKMQHIDLPDNVDSVGIDINKGGIVVEVNTDAVQVFNLGQRLAMQQYDDLIAEAAAER